MRQLVCALIYSVGGFALRLFGGNAEQQLNNRRHLLLVLLRWCPIWIDGHICLGQLTLGRVLQSRQKTPPRSITEIRVSSDAALVLLRKLSSKRKRNARRYNQAKLLSGGASFLSRNHAECFAVLSGVLAFNNKIFLSIAERTLALELAGLAAVVVEQNAQAFEFLNEIPVAERSNEVSMAIGALIRERR